MSKIPGGLESHEYVIPVSGMTVRILGPRYPHALNDDPAVQARAEQDDYKPYWAVPCPAAVMLAEYLIQRADLGDDPVLELGAGLGIVSISLTMAGHRVVVTDYDEDALAFVRASAARNGVALYDVRPLDWRHPPAEQYAAIVGSEILYEKRGHEPIRTLLMQCLRSAGRAFFSDTNRSAADEFPAGARAAGLSVDVVSTRAKAIPGFNSVDERMFRGRVFRVSKK